MRGVGAVTRVGGVSREVRVEIDPARLQALNATAADISRQLRQVQREASGGRTDLGGAEQSVRTIATVQSAAELAALEITLSDGRRIRLDQVANVSDTVAERRSAALLDGQEVVGFEIVRTRGAGEIEVAAGVRKQLEVLKAQHPEISVVEAFNFVDPVEENYQGSMALAVRRRRARRPRRVPVPARLARDAGRDDGAAALGDPGVLADVAARLHAQRGDAARALARRRHPGRRRDRRDREHHAPPAHGQAPVRRRDGSGRRDRPGGDRDDLHAHRRVPADRVHERRAGQVLRPVRLDRGDRRLHLAGRRAHADADDVGLRAEGAEEGVPRGALDRDLHALGAGVPAPSRLDDARRDRLLRRLARPRAAAADRLHPARRPVADAGLDRARARRDVRADARGRGSRARRSSRRTRTSSSSTPRSAAAAPAPIRSRPAAPPR